MKTYSVYEKYNAHCRPDWRWAQVLSLCDRYPTPGRASPRDDVYVRAAREFLLTYRYYDNNPSAREALFLEQPELYYAYQLHMESQKEPEPAFFIQARLLARQRFKTIAEMQGMLPGAIEWYEKLFFNVLPRINCPDWINKQVLMPAVLRKQGRMTYNFEDGGINTNNHSQPDVICDGFLDATLKFFAYYGGPLLVDSLISGFQTGQPVDSIENIGAWFDQNYKRTIKRRSLQAAMVFPITKWQLGELFSTHSRIMELESSAGNVNRQQNNMERGIAQLLKEIPFCVGEDAEKQDLPPQLLQIDKGAAELRDRELMEVASGKVLPNWFEDVPAELPAPRNNRPSAEKPT